MLVFGWGKVVLRFPKPTRGSPGKPAFGPEEGLVAAGKEPSGPPSPGERAYADRRSLVRNKSVNKRPPPERPHSPRPGAPSPCQCLEAREEPVPVTALGPTRRETMSHEMPSPRLRAAAVLAFALGACTGAGPSGTSGPAGAPGAPGTPAVDTGSITGTVSDPSGAAASGAAVSTTPTTVAVVTNAEGAFTLSGIPIGAYTLTAAKSGYASGTLAGVGVGAGATVHVTLALAPATAGTGVLSGTVSGRKGSSTSGANSVPVPNATVCVEGTGNCTATRSDGSYTLAGVSPGPVFVSAASAPFLPGEIRQAVELAPAGSVSGVNLALSGQPASGATYVGSATCLSCHSTFSAGLVSAWQGSAHATVVDLSPSLPQLDLTGWPLVGASCTSPGTADSGLAAIDPVSNATREVFLLQYPSSCTPVFAMAFADATGLLSANSTVLPVNGTIGGVATAAGQCSNGGVIPAGTPCQAEYNVASPATTTAAGWWEQEYLIDIGSSSKNQPSWATWITSRIPWDALALPLAWTQRQQQGGTGAWVPAPDYFANIGVSPQAAAFSQSCAGCHDTGSLLSTDASGNVTSYTSGGQGIGCERCHGPGSAHASSGGDASLIVNPAYLTAQASLEVCGQCHVNGGTSVSPAGAFDFAWNDQVVLGNGNFVPGVDSLASFEVVPAYGDPAYYWPSGFPSIDHTPFMDLQGSVHGNNPYQKITCTDCHDAHGLVGGPYEFVRTDESSGDQFAFQANALALADDVVCLACHATHGPFSALALSDVARYHLSAGGAVLQNGVAYAATSTDEATSASLVATNVNAHMLTEAGMYAFFDPMAVSGAPVGRCSTCHMAKTSWTASFFSGPDAAGVQANVIGDVSSHVFTVATPQDSLATLPGAASWDAVMPNACGSCHPEYRFGVQ